MKTMQLLQLFEDDATDVAVVEDVATDLPIIEDETVDEDEHFEEPVDEDESTNETNEKKSQLTIISMKILCHLTNLLIVLS